MKKIRKYFLLFLGEFIDDSSLSIKASVICLRDCTVFVGRTYGGYLTLYLQVRQNPGRELVTAQWNVSKNDHLMWPFFFQVAVAAVNNQLSKMTKGMLLSVYICLPFSCISAAQYVLGYERVSNCQYVHIVEVLTSS